MMSQTLRLSDGLSVHAILAGSGDPVLLIHGVGLRAEAWGPQTEALARTHHVIAIDLPGHGESDPLPGTPGLPDYVAWAARVVTALRLGPVSVAGHSMGALIAAGLAVEHPDHVRRVALLNGVHRRSPEARKMVLARAAEIAVTPGDVTSPLARWFSAQDAALRDEVAAWLRTVPAKGYAAAYRAFAEGDDVYADRLSEIRCPLLALTGDKDANSTTAMTQTMAAAAPQGTAVVIAGHRHLVNLTDPAAVTAELENWLARRQTLA